MRLLALCTWCPFPMVNGSTLRAYHLLRALSARCDIDLVTFSAPTPPDATAVAHLREFCHDVTVIPTSPFARVAGNRPGGLFSGTPRSLVETHNPAVRALVRERASRADGAVGFALAAARYLDGLDRPHVFEEAEPRQIAGQIDDATSTLRRLRRRLTWWKHARYLRDLVSGMAAVTVVSDRERESMVEIGVEAARIHVVPNGADGVDLGRPRTVAAPPRLIYSGAITYGPNLDAVRWFLGSVMPAVHAARPDVEFWVTGDTGDGLVDTLPNRHLARFTGRLPDVKSAVGDATVVVVPLLSGGGTRLKVLEAMALGTPVVTTSKGVEGIDAADGTHLLVGDTAEAFSGQVLRVLGDAGLARRLSDAGRDRVRTTYTWDAIGQRFASIVTAAIEGTPS